MDRMIAGLRLIMDGFLKECGKKLLGWLWDQAPDAVNKWLEKIYGFFPQGDFSCCLLIGLVLGVFIGASSMKVFFRQGYFRCCLLIGLVLGVFIVAPFMKAKMACQNEPLNSQIRIANQGENARPSTGQTRTTDADNDVNLPTQNETTSPEDRSTSQKEDKRPSPGQSDASYAIDEGKLHRTILNDSIINMLQDLDFQAICPYLVKKELFDELTIFDISHSGHLACWTVNSTKCHSAT